MKGKEKIALVGLSIMLSLTLTGCFVSKPVESQPSDVENVLPETDNVKEQKPEPIKDDKDSVKKEVSTPSEPENTLTIADIPALVDMTAKTLEIEPDKASDNYRLASELFQYMFLPDVCTRGGDCVQGLTYYQGMIFACVDINGDGQKEAFVGPDLYAMDMIIPADTFEEGNVIGGILKINPETGIFQVSDSVAPHYCKLDKTVEDYIRVWPVLDDDEDKPEDESLQFYVYGKKNKKTFLTLEDAMNYGSDLEIFSLDKSGITWIYLTPENVINSLFKVEPEPVG